METTNKKRVICPICKLEKKRREVITGKSVKEGTIKVIKKDNPDWHSSGIICFDDLNKYRAIYIQEALSLGKGKISSLEEEVVESTKQHDILTENINKEFDKTLTFGEKISDKIATFGGSWKFIISFMAILISWITFNTISLYKEPFDPFPYILLNLVLSCIAALQAPVIMMSQNRQEHKDRVRSEGNYKIDLKAELEIRHLHSKIDMLLNNQWQNLMEVQNIQVKMIQELVSRDSEHRE